MHMQPKPLHYRSYLLRLWQVFDHRPDARLVVRCSLEDPHTGERRGFASLEALSTFLHDELVVGGEQGRGPRAPAAHTPARGGDVEKDERGWATADGSAAL